MDAPPLQVSQCTLGHCWLVDSTEETASWYGLEIVILIGPLYHLYILTIDISLLWGVHDSFRSHGIFDSASVSKSHFAYETIKLELI